MITPSDRLCGPRPDSDCKLDSLQLETQLERYQRLGQYAINVVRLPGEVIVRFGTDVPSGLLAQALEVERRCCPFIHATYDPGVRQLTLTVETIDQVPTLDSLHNALGVISADATQCCDPTALSTCCEPESKDACCGAATVRAATNCGCRP